MLYVNTVVKCLCCAISPRFILYCTSAWSLYVWVSGCALRWESIVPISATCVICRFSGSVMLHWLWLHYLLAATHTHTNAQRERITFMLLSRQTSTCFTINTTKHRCSVCTAMVTKPYRFYFQPNLAHLLHIISLPDEPDQVISIRAEM